MAISQNFPNVAGNFTVNFAEAKALDPRMTFTRSQTSSTGSTYVGADGLIKYAASNQPRFEHQATERTNLFTYSEDFSNVAWLKGNSTVASNTTATTAPDGTFTADKLVENSSIGNKEVYQFNAVITGGINYTVSIFAKAAERTIFRLAMDTARFSAQTNAYFNLSTGVVTLTEGGVVSASITPIGGGWFRCSATMSPTSTGSSSVYITLVESGTTSNYTGNGSSGIYIWGAQFEIGTPMGDYIPTTASAVTRTRVRCLGLLTEETRTNLLTRSEELDNNTSWATDNSGLTVTANSVVSPDGSTTADTLTEAATNSSHNRYQSVGLVTATPYTFSVFIKPNTVTRVSLGFGYAGIGGGGQAIYDLTSGSVISSFLSGADPGSGLSASIVRYTNNWYRCILTVTPSITNLTYFASILLVNSSNNTVYTGNTANNVYAWGAQLENRQCVSSYIPTTSSSVTRAQDLASIRGAGFTSIYNQNEGTFRAEGIFNDPINNPIRYGGVFAAGNGTSGHNGIFYNPQPAYGYYCSNDQQTPATQLEATNSPYSLGVPFKIACSYNSNEQFSVVKNGGTVQNFTQPGALLRSHRYFQIGGNAINQNTQGVQTIANITYYSRKLTDSQMQTLTR